MKVIISAIGRFFAGIWRWIKETAWVQPLLIVSLIFGIILLIQPISAGITDVADWITNYQRIYKNNSIDLDDVEDVIFGEGDQFKDADRYFLVIVQNDCPGCEEAYPGFEKLFNDDTFDNGGKEFKIKTVYVDQYGENFVTDKGEPNKDHPLYNMFLSNDDKAYELRERITYVAESTSYYDTIYSTDETYNKYTNFIDTEDSNEETLTIYTPTILLMDKETFEEDNSTFGIKEAIITVKGFNNDHERDSSAYSKANTLEHMWNSDWENLVA